MLELRLSRTLLQSGSALCRKSGRCQPNKGTVGITAAVSHQQLQNHIVSGGRALYGRKHRAWRMLRDLLSLSKRCVQQQQQHSGGICSDHDLHALHDASIYFADVRVRYTLNRSIATLPITPIKNPATAPSGGAQCFLSFALGAIS